MDEITGGNAVLPESSGCCGLAVFLMERTMYKLELHCHTREVSACSNCPAEREIEIYLQAGYSGLVSTNHINRGTYEKLPADWSWERKAEHFLAGFEALKKAAGEDFDVLLGCEINLSPVEPLPPALQAEGWAGYVPNDYLIYGVTADWIMNTGDMRYMTLEELSCSAREAGFLIVHAHPFRVGTVMQNPDLVDGYEVYNGNPWHDSHNDLADAWADLKGKIKTSGTDLHKADDYPRGGIETETRIRDNAALLKTLKSGNYKLIR